jgi:hypothetical protein
VLDVRDLGLLVLQGLAQAHEPPVELADGLVDLLAEALAAQARLRRSLPRGALGRRAGRGLGVLGVRRIRLGLLGPPTVAHVGSFRHGNAGAQGTLRRSKPT